MSLHSRAMSAEWLEAMLGRYRGAPSDVPEDWRRALGLLEAAFPHLWDDTVPQGRSDPWRWAHLSADLDPLNLPLSPRWAALRDGAAKRGGGASMLGLTVETGHLDDLERHDWLCGRLDTLPMPESTARVVALERLIRAETFEAFMARRYAGKKRFGVEGAETLHALVGRLLDRAAATGVEEVIVAPMHRGRLSLAACLFGQPLATGFAGMSGAHPLADATRAGDVPYHMGSDAVVETAGGPLRVVVLPNPSHLEAVNAVALGYARRRAEVLGGVDKVLTLILHTDASVVAQGVVAEGLQLSETEGHAVGGTIHVVVNNQVGFTTEPHEARTSRWCTGPFKAIDSLIAHVSGDAPDAALTAADLAINYRRRFGGDAVVDLVCVRANGHNELDEPRFTQPAYVEAAGRRRPVVESYAAALAAAGLNPAEQVARIADTWREQLGLAFANGESVADRAAIGSEIARPHPAAPLDVIAELAGRTPEGAQLNAKAVRLVAQRTTEWRSDAVSWATAEVLALGAVLSTGADVRLTGQDVERGAFSQRHLALIEPDGRRRPVFEEAPADWGALTVVNSPLTEYAALGFAYGYSVAAPGALTIWEAQFGDFANVAQVVFDQFLCGGDEKWGQRSNLAVLLPHGLEGQGPEHSSARIERVLQLAARDNLRIAHPSTPANHFHLLRAQAAERRPLIVFTPKKLLRLKAAVSPRAASRRRSSPSSRRTFRAPRSGC